MRSSSPLLRSAAFVTLLSLLIRTVGLYCQSRIAGLVGAEGMGLLQLSMAVQALAVTFGTSGIRYSVTRLLAEELGLGRPRGTAPALRACFLYAFLFSGAAALAGWQFAEPLARFAGDGRIALSLRFWALGLPFLALNAVFGGYFTAVQRPWKASVSQLLEQLVMTVFIMIYLPLVGRGDLGRSCAVIGLGGALADGASLLLSLALFCLERRHFPCGGPPPVPIAGRLVRLSLPLALSSYARTALSTLQHLLVPKALKRGGVGAAAALGVYGTVSGMALPVLGFASVFFYALAEVIIPDLTEAQMQRDQPRLDRTVSRVLSACLLLAAAIALILYLAGPWLGLRLYKSVEAGRYIRVLAPLVVILYLDSIVDGMLKGLGMQLDSMLINIVDAGLTLLMVWFLLPRWGATAYIGILYFSECFNFLISYRQLSKTVSIKLL